MKLGKLYDTPLKMFVVRAAVLFICWQAAYLFFILPDGRLNYWLTEKVGQGAVWLGEEVIGGEAAIVPLGNTGSNTEDAVAVNGLQFFWNGQLAVNVGHPCNGLELMALFIGFILLVPGSLRHKWWYLLIGIFAIYLVNATRVVLLGINYIQNIDTFDFNHKYTYSITAYAVVFILWMVWVEFFANIKQSQKA